MQKLNGGYMTHLVMFSPAQIALTQEVSKHQDLLQKLSQLGDSPDFLRSLEIIATHLDVVLDGAYMPADIDTICDRLTQKLMQRRTLVITLDM